MSTVSILYFLANIMSKFTHAVILHTTTITILSWFLAPSCPPNSHYTTCLLACSPTCEYLNGPQGCNENQPCTQGCACDEGFVQRGRICVPIQQCGCVDSNGKKYQVCECLQRNLHTMWIFKYVSLLSSKSEHDCQKVRVCVCTSKSKLQLHLFLASSMKGGTQVTAVRNVSAKENKTLEWLNAKTRKNAVTTPSAFQMPKATTIASRQVQ